MQIRPFRIFLSGRSSGVEHEKRLFDFVVALIIGSECRSELHFKSPVVGSNPTVLSLATRSSAGLEQRKSFDKIIVAAQVFINFGECRWNYIICNDAGVGSNPTVSKET